VPVEQESVVAGEDYIGAVHLVCLGNRADQVLDHDVYAHEGLLPSAPGLYHHLLAVGLALACRAVGVQERPFSYPRRRQADVRLVEAWRRRQVLVVVGMAELRCYGVRSVRRVGGDDSEPWRVTLSVVADEGFGPLPQVVRLVLLILGVGFQLAVLVNRILIPVGDAAERVPLVPTRRHVARVLVAV